jgi:hypothetical protein
MFTESEDRSPPSARSTMSKLTLTSKRLGSLKKFNWLTLLASCTRRVHSLGNDLLGFGMRFLSRIPDRKNLNEDGS